MDSSNDTQLSTNVEIALGAAEQGIPVFPVSAEKIPLTPHGFKDATTDAEQIRNWHEDLAPFGWGMPTGKPIERIVLDGDGAEGLATLEALGLSPHVITPSGGAHVYVARSNGGGEAKSKNSARFDPERYPGLDVRGDGGYVVFAAPGYVWKTDSFEGIEWEAIGEDIRFAMLNGKAKYQKEYGKAKKATRAKPSAKGKKKKLGEGDGRNNALISYLGGLRRKGAEMVELVEAADKWNAENCDPLLDDDEIAKVVKSALSYEPADDEGKESISQALVRIIQEEWEDQESEAKEAGIDPDSLAPFHTPDYAGWVRFMVNGHAETHAIKSAFFVRYLKSAYYKATGKPLTKSPLEDTLGLMEAIATVDSPMHSVHNRVAEHEGALYVDLCDERWRAVKITGEGWEIVEAPPVRFRRPERAMALPEPEAGGNLDDLLNLLNVRDEDKPLLMGWIYSAYYPGGPYLIGEVNGEYGSGKTSVARAMRSMVDPRKWQSSLGGTPRNDRDVISVVAQNYVVACDNMSSLSRSTSDLLCQIATGGSASERKLYANFEESQQDLGNPVLINGIDELGKVEDFLSRLVVIHCPTLTSHMKEDDFLNRFREIGPRTMGAIFDALSFGIASLGTFDLGPQTPRMGNVAEWITACEGRHPYDKTTPGGWFVRALEAAQAELRSRTMESEPLVECVVHLMRLTEEWEGSATELLATFDANDTTSIFMHGKNGNATASLEALKRSLQKYHAPADALGKRLKRVAPTLRKEGIIIEQGVRTATSRPWIIRRAGV